jgi:hypothetical protein
MDHRFGARHRRGARPTRSHAGRPRCERGRSSFDAPSISAYIRSGGLAIGARAGVL